MTGLDLSALQGIDVHVHVESDGRGHMSLDDELLEASAQYFKATADRAPSVEQIARVQEFGRAVRSAWGTGAVMNSLREVATKRDQLILDEREKERQAKLAEQPVALPPAAAE